MKNRIISVLFLIFCCQFVFAQGVYGVFTPLPNTGEKQIGTVSPATGAIGLLGNNSSVETGSLDMTTGATALNVAGNKSYFIARDSLNVDRIYTVDLTTGITDTNPVLTANYTTSNNWGVWYDEPNAVLYGIFSNVGGSGTIEMASIDTTTGAVTQIHSDVTGNGPGGLGSGLMTGDSDNNRVFTLVDGELYVIATDSNDTAHFFEVANEVNAALDTSSVFGLEWHKDTGTMWFLYNEDNVNGDRQLMEVMGDDNFNDGDEVFQNANILLDNGDAILTGSGLAALDVQSSVFFFIGRPSSGVNSGLFSLYSVDLNAQTSTNANIQDPAVQTNNYAGIEVLPGPELSFSKTDGGVTTSIPGDTITYTLDYSNAAGAGGTSGLKITETVPAETTFLPGSSTAGWGCLPDNNAGATCELSPAQIGPGGSGSATFVVQIDDYVSAALTQISNNATLSATNAISDAMAADTTPITAAAVLAVTKTDGDVTDTIPGDSIAYIITASNTGDRVATNVVLTETVPANTFHIPTVPFDWTCLPDNTAGSSCTSTPTDVADTGLATEFHLQVIDSVPAGTTEVSNTVTMSADNASSDQASDTTPITSAAVLSVSKTDGDTSITPGSTVVYQIDYGNTGDQDADSTSLAEIVLTETVFDPSSSSPGWVCAPDNTAGSTCTLDLGTLGGGTSSSVDFGLTLNSPVPGIFSQLDNTVVMDASNASSVLGQDSTPVDASVDLRIVKTDGGVTAALGKVINYTLISFNDGDRNALSVELTETVPDNTTFHPPSSTVGWACTPDNSAGSTCTFDVGSLSGLGGKNSTFFAVKVDSSLDPGVTELSNTASISAFNTLDTDADTELTDVDQVMPSVTLIDANPSITEITSCSQNDAQISEVIVSFQDDNPGLIGVDDPMNFALIDTGADQDLQSSSCDLLEGDDVAVNVNSFVVGGTATNPIANLTLDGPLAAGQYVLMICDDITDAAGNAIDGDQNGLPGGHLLRQFRVEFDNLFDNAYLDDCVDAPIALTPWMAINDAGDFVDVNTLNDFDSSSLSGSIFLDSASGNAVAIEQCVNFPSDFSHAVSTAILGLPSQSADVEMLMTCDFSDQLDCGNITSNHSETFTLSPSVTPQWNRIESIMLLEPNSL
ncbi:MAG: hypothetical protein ACSHWU_06665, partial [Marinicella sp.]